VSNSNGDVFNIREGRLPSLARPVELWSEESLPRAMKIVGWGIWIVFAVSFITSLLMWMYPSANWLDLFSQIRMEPLD